MCVFMDSAFERMKARWTEEGQSVEKYNVNITPGNPVDFSVFTSTLPFIVVAQYKSTQHEDLLICDICLFKISIEENCFDFGFVTLWSLKVHTVLCALYIIYEKVMKTLEMLRRI